MRLRSIIADDEIALREHLTRLLNKLWPELEICTAVANGSAALEAINNIKPDIAFLDIRMPGLSGMDVAQRIGNACRVVFITAYDQYAVQAFEQHAIDYLLKPLTEDRLQKTIVRLQHTLNDHPPDVTALVRQIASKLPQQRGQALQWLRVQSGDAIALIHVDDVAYFKAEDKYTTVRTRQGEQVIRTPLKELEETLNKDHFWRIHRNAIVNVRWIEKVHRYFGGKQIIRLKNGIPDELIISRAYTHLFRQM